MRTNQPAFQTFTRTGDPLVLSALKKIYMLLAMTLLFSAGTAYYSLQAKIFLNPFVAMIGIIGIYFLTYATRNSFFGIISVFLFTGFFGLTLGPTLSYYITSFSNGSELITTSLATTGLIFVALSMYVIISKKDFSFMGGFLMIALLAIILTTLIGFFYPSPMMHLVLSAAIALVFSGFILYDTSMIVHRGQTNVVIATIQLYLDIVNLFIAILNILAAFSGNRR